MKTARMHISDFFMCESKQFMRKIVFILLLTLIVVFSGGCSAKNEPLIVTEYKEVYIPTKCLAQMPQKPLYDDNNASTAITLGAYYLEVETLLKRCVDAE